MVANYDLLTNRRINTPNELQLGVDNKALNDGDEKARKEILCDQVTDYF